MNQIYPVLLAGGYGTRLWPISRKSYPKQFLKFVSDQSLFQEAIIRNVDAQNFEFAKPTIITNETYRFIVRDQLTEIGIDPFAILLEPEVKNTAAAVLAASLHALSHCADPIIIASPCDHFMPDKEYLHTCIETGIVHLADGNFVTFGVEPTSPETGYGYLEVNKELVANKAHTLNKFHEKPNQTVANDYYRSGNFLWNSGIFMFRAIDMIKAFKDLHPNIFEAVRLSLDCSELDLNFRRLSRTHWESVSNVSIDKAIMEHSKNLVVVPYLSEWSDLGSWDAVTEVVTNTDLVSPLIKNVDQIRCEKTFLATDDPSTQLIGVGLESIIVVASKDAILVANKEDRSAAQDALKHLEAVGKRQAHSSLLEHRPWGSFETLSLEDNCHVKKIIVKPGASLSLQSHKFRSEHWIVVAGTAKVQVDLETLQLLPGESIYIPLGSKHRLSNPGSVPTEIIEVQTGTYFGEDDIQRYEDIYHRQL